ncbi:MAG TPA: hypothetical protein VF290_22745 [Pyrinomonadaceae bacterium]
MNKQAMFLKSLTVGAVVCALVFLSLVSARAIFRPELLIPGQNKVRPKSLKERALERDVEVESTSESDLPTATLPVLTSGSSAITVGKITSAVAAELHTLNSLNVVSLDLDFKESKKEDTTVINFLVERK